MEELKDGSEVKKNGSMRFVFKGPQIRSHHKIPVDPLTYILTPKLMKKPIQPKLNLSISTNSRQPSPLQSRGSSPKVAYHKESFIKPLVGDAPFLKQKSIQGSLNFTRLAKPLQYKSGMALERPKKILDLSMDFDELPTPVGDRKDGSMPRMQIWLKNNPNGTQSFSKLKQFSDYITSYKSEKKQKQKQTSQSVTGLERRAQYSLEEYRSLRETSRKPKNSQMPKSILKKKIRHGSLQEQDLPTGTSSTPKKRVVFSPEITVFLFFKDVHR